MNALLDFSAYICLLATLLPGNAVVGYCSYRMWREERKTVPALLFAGALLALDAGTAFFGWRLAFP